jgi:16S rRNA (uracil1498-N3)-methyltransferase
MTDPVFFVDEVPPPGRFVLGGDEGHHAATVKRLRAGERMVLSDGQGSWAPATVLAAEGRSLAVDVGAVEYDAAPVVSVTLVQALPKGERSDLAIDLATEAGVDAIVPWQASRCVARWDGASGKADRGRRKWQRIAREAAKQSRRRRIPRVGELAGAADVVAEIHAADLAVVLHEEGSMPLSSVPLPPSGIIVLVVGPEGGLTSDELDRFAAAGARVARLGPEVLRTSTAAAVALGALGVTTGRWS